MSGLRAFRHAIPALQVHVGEECLDQLPAMLARAGCRRAVIVCGRSMARLGADRLRAALGPACGGVFDGVLAHSPIPAVVAAAEALREAGADAVVALGGGSAIVTARAAGILLAEGGSVPALCTRFTPGQPPESPRLRQPKLPQFVVATTPTTAAAKAGSAVLDPASGRRLTMFDPKTRAQALFLDPALLSSAPVGLVRDAAVNGFAMAMQGLESPKAEALSDALLLHAVRLFRAWLPRLEAEPASGELRGQLALAALLCGQGTDYAPAGLASVIGHCVGARFGVEIGRINAVVLPHALRFNGPATVARRAVAFDGATAERVGEECAAFFATLGLPGRLRDLGLSQGDLPVIAEDAAQDWFLQENPRRVDATALTELLNAAW